MASGIGASGTSAGTAAAQVAHFCFMKGNEDLIQGFDGQLLVLHGDVDHVVPSQHARRLYAAAAHTMSRQLVLAKGKRQDSLRSSEEYCKALCSFFNEQPQAKDCMLWH